jgi:hypothetical protein
MSQSVPTIPAEVNSPRPRGRLPQLGLSTLLLATACIAAWGSAWFNHRRIATLDKSIANMKALNRELIVKDRDHIAVIQQQPLVYDQQIWHVYIPSDSLELRLATRDVLDDSRKAIQSIGSAAHSAPLSKGQHVIELRSELQQTEWVTQAIVDEQPLIVAREPKDWNAARGSSGGGQFAAQSDLPADQPVVLFSRIFMLPNGPMDSIPATGPSNGIILWIEEARTQP